MPTDISTDSTPDGVPERLVQAAIRLLAEQGPSAIKARTVASAAGLSTMAVYTTSVGSPSSPAPSSTADSSELDSGVFPAARDR